MLKQLHKQKGINLIEVLVTIIITSVGLLGLNSLQLKATRSVQDSGNKSQAVWIIDDLTNRMRANLVGIASYDTGGEKDCNALSVTKQCSAYHTLSARVTAHNDCTAAEQAKSDIYAAICGMDNGAGSNDLVFSGAASFIADPKINIKVSASREVDINLSWSVRTSGTDEDGEAIYSVENLDDDSTLRASITAKVHP